MVRLVKRYGSRKLYDTEESRYVSLEEIGAWIRAGQEIRVIDNQTTEDVTAQTLTQVILEEGKRGSGTLPTALLHDLIRRGGEIVDAGVGTLQQGVDRLMQASLDRLPPVREIREETRTLRRRLEELEQTLSRLERRPEESPKEPAPAETADASRPTKD